MSQVMVIEMVMAMALIQLYFPLLITVSRLLHGGPDSASLVGAN